MGARLAQNLVISKDLVNELRRLAGVAEKDQTNFQSTRDKYVRATNTTLKSSGVFAIALYDFALRYSTQPALIDAELVKLNIKVKPSSSVYYRIARLAFDDPSGEDVNLPQASKYGQLIEQAHKLGKLHDEFVKLVSAGIDNARKKLAPVSDADVKLQLGRSVASSLLQNKQFAIDGMGLPEGVSEGDEVELLARCENGQIVVYGMVPKSKLGTAAILAKLGAAELGSRRQRGDIFPDMLRTIKLVATEKQYAKGVGTFTQSSDGVQFVISANGSHAIMSAALDADFLSGKALSLHLSEWERICTTMGLLQSKPLQIAFDGKTLTTSVEGSDIYDLNAWFEEKGKRNTTGKVDGVTISIDLEPMVLPADLLSDEEWKEVGQYTLAQLSPLLDFVPDQKLASVTFSSAGITVTSAKAKVAGETALTRKTLSLVKSVCRKLERLSERITIERGKAHIRVSGVTKQQVRYALVVSAS